MRPVFCGNLDFDARQSDVERLFKRYGKVERVDMKSGFAFIYMEDERDAEYAIRRLDRTEFGRKGRRIRVEWTKQERDSRRSGDSRKSSSNSRPSKTLFIINFDPVHTRTRDLERHFDPYGKISNIRIRRNFAFIQYETQEDATRALEATNLSKFMDRVITVEYAIKDDDDRRNGYSPDRRAMTPLMGDMAGADPRVHIAEVGVAQIMVMDRIQLPDQNQEEAQSMNEVKAQSMADMTAGLLLHEKGLLLHVKGRLLHVKGRDPEE
ncbi:LOW QUALITY PROTEIN: serine/arginine-rich splicing factor RS41-like [Arachis ipaensis]|uniref:LOW QUALITY PROTEIN: serine/arginine-rich splicing factor RS41-like n=1 Tax=Arachis ipaensis TaxID=130454 RepID=UPI0007AF2B32|nr:LOW QUALITY PROTEIN: serine/arginine-rich splicing factor RS41-like [Arachis ipaensis]